jgi:hypothetical protein
LVVLVSAAGMQDTVDGRTVMDELATRHRTVVKPWMDGRY